MKVTLVNHMGTDLTVVNAARVSFAKESEWASLLSLSNEDERLIRYLARHKHWTPFGHCSVQFRVKAPIFVARQLVKHQVGLVWNEVSRRYVDSPPEFYIPSTWRGRPKNKKQGSSEEEVEINPGGRSGRAMVDDYQNALERCLWTYEQLLRKGVSPEMARMVLPLSTYTEWYWTGSLIAFSRICSLRTKADSQEETRQVAEQISEHCASLFPVSWEALSELC